MLFYVTETVQKQFLFITHRGSFSTLCHGGDSESATKNTSNDVNLIFMTIVA